MSGSRPFSDFYNSLAGAKEVRPVDQGAVGDALDEVVTQVLGGDQSRLPTLTAKAGGVAGVNRLWLSSNKNPAVFSTLAEGCLAHFQSDASKLADVITALGSGAAAAQFMQQNSADHIKDVLETLGPAKMTGKSLAQLANKDTVDQERARLVQAFVSNPKDDTLAPLVRLGLIQPGKVEKIVETGKAMIATLSTTGATADRVTVEATCEPPELDDGAAVVNTVELLAGGKKLKPRNPAVGLKLADPCVIWVAWLDFRRSKANTSTKRDDLKKLDFFQLPKLSLVPDGKYEAYQANVDKVEGAKLGGGLTGFSYSSGIKSSNSGINITGLWVLHVHCRETKVDKDVCTDFVTTAASLKLAEGERVTGAATTLKCDLSALGPAADDASDSEKQSQQALVDMLTPVSALANMCDKATILRLWNAKRKELAKDASSAQLYERHNVAPPQYDLKGWLNTLRHDRIPFCFLNSRGWKGHADQVQNELTVLAKYADEVVASMSGEKKEKEDDGEEPFEVWKRLELATQQIKIALEKAASEKTSIKRTGGREMEVEDFDFSYTFDMGKLGAFTVVRDKGDVWIG